MTQGSHLTDFQLDELYTKTFGRQAYHMTREGYLHYLADVLPEPPKAQPITPEEFNKKYSKLSNFNDDMFGPRRWLKLVSVGMATSELKNLNKFPDFNKDFEASKLYRVAMVKAFNNCKVLPPPTPKKPKFTTVKTDQLKAGTPENLWPWYDFKQETIFINLVAELVAIKGKLKIVCSTEGQSVHY